MKSILTASLRDIATEADDLKPDKLDAFLRRGLAASAEARTTGIYEGQAEVMASLRRILEEKGR